MKNTIYLDNDFNFLLLENEEADTGLSQTKIYINIPTSDATNQELEISVAGGAPITESIPSEALVNFELSQQYWADNGDVEITPKNDDVTGDTITIHFPETFTVSAALNYLYNDEFEIVAQNEDFAEGGGSGSGSGSGGGSAFDFVETIRNIGFRLLDEPSNVNAYFDEVAEEVQIKWTDPADISTNEPAPATWAGTVVVRKEGSAPLHRWDGVLIVDSTTRDQYASSALIDNTLDISKKYYYGIFPYDTKGDYRFTKTILVSSQPIPAPQINSLSAAITSISVNYSVAFGYTYDYITLVYKKNSAPTDKTDGTAVSLSASDTSVDITGLDDETTYYFKIFAKVTGQSEELESNIENATTGTKPLPNYRCLSSINVDGVIYNLLQITDFALIPQVEIEETTRIRSATLQSLSLNHPNFVTFDGDSFYHHTQETHNASRRDICNNNYMTLSCPSGLFDSAGIQVNGLIWDNNVSSSRISTWGTGAATVDSGYRDYYLGVIIDDVYERGFVIIMAHSHNFDSASLEGYQAYIYGGKVGDTDYIYETFKNA